MTHNTRTTALSILALATGWMLTACGGGGGGGSDDDPAATDSQIIANLASSNIQSTVAQVAHINGTWRWTGTPGQHVAVYVTPPAAGNATEQDYAAKTRTAITTINRKLAGLLVLEAVDTVPSTGNYIHVSYGTSYVPPGSTDYASYCANVSTAPGVGYMILPAGDGSIASSPVHVNLGNGHCDVTQDIVTHEFGHALGLSSHFSGFGNDAAISEVYWDVLATLYANPVLTTVANLTVRRAAD